MDELKNRIYKTAKSRFYAAARLEKKQCGFVKFITFLTIMQIGASIVLLKLDSNPDYTLVACLAITCSILIAIISNSYSLTKDALNAYLLHKCGMELINLYNRMMCSGDSSIKIDFVNNYDKILKDCAVNHELIDFQQAECQILAKGKLWSIYYRLKMYINSYTDIFIYFLFSVIVGLVIYLLING